MLGALVRFDLHQRLFADRLRGRTYPPRARHRYFLDGLLLYRPDFFGIRFDLFQFRGPFDLDRNCRGIAGAGRNGIHLRRRLLGIFAHLLVFKRRTLDARFLVRTACRPDVLGHRACRHRLELAGSRRCQPRGRCCHLARWTKQLSFRRFRLRPAYGLSAAAFPLALLLAVAAAAAAPSAPSFTLLAVLARRRLVLCRTALRLLRLLLPRSLALGMLPVAFVPSLVVSILLVAVTPAVALLVAAALVVLALTALLPAFRLAIAASAVSVAAFVPAAVLRAFRKRGTRSAFCRRGGRG